MGSVYGLVLAAGGSTRMGGQVNKQLLELAGRTLVEYSIQALLNVPVDGIVLVVSKGEEPQFVRKLGGFIEERGIKLVWGGTTRGDSVRQGLGALPLDARLVVVHDGARPLVKPENIREALREARHWGASTLAVPVKDTIKIAGTDNLVQETPAREMLWQVQTPQVFECALLREAHRVALQDGYVGTDDASLVERLGHPVKLVPGQYTNIKVTTPEDLLLVKMFLSNS